MAIKKTRKIDARTREKIVQQACDEIDFAREYKKKRIEDWHRNEALVFHKKVGEQDVRSNIGIANTKAVSFVSTLLSKVDTAPNIKFNKQIESDLLKAKHTNAMFERDMSPQNQNLVFKDLLGKRSAIIYGRAIYGYHASSPNKKYKSVLNLISPYNFFIDPAAGGIDIERADYCGHSGIWKSKYQLESDPKYIKAEVKKIVEGAGDTSQTGKENKDKADGLYYITGENEKIRKDSSTYHFVEWYTTFEGKRYYVLFSEERKVAIRLCEMKELFEKELYPYWTWATDPDPEEFWTLSPLDNVREIFIKQGQSVDYLMDNAERIVKPMRGVVAGSIKNLSDLRYGRDKVVSFKKGTDLAKSVRIFETPEITTPTNVYNILEGIGNLESGVSAATKGVAEEEKVGIYEGNLAAVADRLGLLNKSYSDGYHRLAKLYKYGLDENLTGTESIKLMGKDGVEYKDITSKDIKGSKDFEIVVDASEAEIQADRVDKRNKLVFLQSKATDPTFNQKVRAEMEAEIAGFSRDDINRLLDVDNYGDAELMAKAAEDIETLLELKKPVISPHSTTAYMNKILTYAEDHYTELSKEQHKALMDHLGAVRDTVIANTVRKAREEQRERVKEFIRTGGNPQIDINQKSGQLIAQNKNAMI